MNDQVRQQFAESVETIERSYEFMLAYAAQGRSNDEGSELRKMLTELYRALEQLLSDVPPVAGEFEGKDRRPGFLKVIGDDADKAMQAVGLVLAQPTISSQLIDNLNASIHVRALLTDMFLLDEVTRSQGGGRAL